MKTRRWMAVCLAGCLTAGPATRPVAQPPTPVRKPQIADTIRANVTPTTGSSCT
jgi:hypothetical protein